VKTWREALKRRGSDDFVEARFQLRSHGLNQEGKCHMRVIAPLVSVAVLALSSQALAQAAAPSQPASPQSSNATTAKPGQAAKPAKGSPDEVICRHEPDPGSRLGGARICHTRADWDDMSRVQRQEIERAQEQRGGQPS
jgi:hypothetical protein